MQLRVDGTEVVHPAPDAVWPTRTPPLTELQRELLAVLREACEIRSVVAGRIVHNSRGYCGTGAKEPARYYGIDGPVRRGLGCCNYAASDGLEALKRLERRGYVERVGRGRWRAK